MKADLVVFDDNFDVHMTIVEGKIVFARTKVC
jgi:N-acetylglucosamine-6-phosphate deacetylase